MTEQLSLRVDPLADAVQWRERFPDAWWAVVRWAHEDRKMGIAPSTRLYACILRRPHMAEMLGLTYSPGSPVLVNDHITSGLARLLNRLYPELKVPTREAAADRWAS